MSDTLTAEEKRSELHALIEDMEIALLTTQRPDGMLVTRPMATQAQQSDADLWFVTDIDTHKANEIDANPEVSVGYFNHSTNEWVSVSGRARITQDRARIRELHSPDWKMWFPDEGGDRDGGPDDPRLALIFVDATTVHYMKSKYSKPRALFEIARGMVTGEQPDIGRHEALSPADLNG